MNRFYFFLWLYWLVRVILCTLFIAAFLAFFITFFIYMKQGFVPLEESVQEALLEVWSFWFAISLNLALLLALFRSVKYLFNHCHAGYMLKLKSCSKEASAYIEPVGYGNLVKVWRKWFMLLIWLVGSLMVVALVFTYIFTSYNSLFEWFNIYILYLFIAISAYISFILMAARCKSVRIVKC